MSSDEQEALSHQHYGLWIVPLAGGSVAVFNHPAGRLLAITEWSKVKDIPLPSPPTYRLVPTAKGELTLEDLFR